MTDLIERLRDAAADAAAEEYGVAGLLNEAATALEAAREALDRETSLKGGVEHQRDALWAELEAAGEDAERYRWLRDHDNAFLLSEDVIDDQIAIDQARGKGVEGA